MNSKLQMNQGCVNHFTSQLTNQIVVVNRNVNMDKLDGFNRRSILYHFPSLGVWIDLDWFMVFNANNISVISWRLVLLVEETSVGTLRKLPTCRK